MIEWTVINEAEGVELCKELSDLWNKAGMQTDKWLSISPVVTEGIPQKDTAFKL